MFALGVNIKLSITKTSSKDGTVRWFEVPMYDFTRMHEREAVGNIVHDSQDHSQFDIRGDMYFGRLRHLPFDADH